jgi:hypothetical protein
MYSTCDSYHLSFFFLGQAQRTCKSLLIQVSRIWWNQCLRCNSQYFFLNLNQRFNAYLIYNPLALSGILREQELFYEYGGWNLNYGLWEKLFISIVRTTAQDSEMFAAGKSSRRDRSLILLLILIPRMIYQESESLYALWQKHLHCMRPINMLVFLLQWDELDMKLSGRILLQVFVWCCKLDQSGCLFLHSLLYQKKEKEDMQSFA